MTAVPDPAPPTEQRRKPAPPQDRRSRNTTYASDATAHRAEDGYAAPIAEERREAELLAELRALGYGITVPCLVCGHPLTSRKSLAAHVGPRCAAKAVA